MNVGELKKIFEQYPEDMELLVERWSDYAPVKEVSVIRGVKKDGWVMRSHPTMSEENKAQEKEYLFLGWEP